MKQDVKRRSRGERGKEIKTVDPICLLRLFLLGLAAYIDFAKATVNFSLPLSIQIQTRSEL